MSVHEQQDYTDWMDTTYDFLGSDNPDNIYSILEANPGCTEGQHFELLLESGEKISLERV